MTDAASDRWGLRRILALVLLIAASLLGNVLAPQLFTGFNYLLGSIGVMLVLRLFGVVPALCAALLAAAWCKQLFGHYYPLLWLGLEPLFVWFWLKRRPQDSLIMADLLYWLTAGLPLLIFVFFALLKVAALGTAAAALMYLAIGVTNALVATLLLSQFSLEQLIWPQRPAATVSVSQLIFQILMLAVVLPALLVLVLTGRSRELSLIHI